MESQGGSINWRINVGDISFIRMPDQESYIFTAQVMIQFWEGWNKKSFCGELKNWIDVVDFDKVCEDPPIETMGEFDTGLDELIGTNLAIIMRQKVVEALHDAAVAEYKTIPNRYQ